MANRKRASTRRSKSTLKAKRGVRTEMHPLRGGKHPIKSRKQAVAVGVNKARRKGAKMRKPTRKSR